MRATWIIAALIIVAAVVYFVYRPTPVLAPAATPDIIAGVPNATYTDQRLSFSMQYPSTATSSAYSYEGYLAVTQTPLVSFVLPHSMYEGTNLGDAGVYIGATTSPQAMKDCLAAGKNGPGTVSTSTIDGATFAVVSATEAGAGNLYETKDYRTYQNGACLEIVEMLHSGNIGNYTPGAVVEFDHAKFLGILEAIVGTYHPIPTGI